MIRTRNTDIALSMFHAGSFGRALRALEAFGPRAILTVHAPPDRGEARATLTVVASDTIAWVRLIDSFGFSTGPSFARSLAIGPAIAFCDAAASVTRTVVANCPPGRDHAGKLYLACEHSEAIDPDSAPEPIEELPGSDPRLPRVYADAGKLSRALDAVCMVSDADYADFPGISLFGGPHKGCTSPDTCKSKRFVFAAAALGGRAATAELTVIGVTDDGFDRCRALLPGPRIAAVADLIGAYPAAGVQVTVETRGLIFDVGRGIAGAMLGRIPGRITRHSARFAGDVLIAATVGRGDLLAGLYGSPSRGPVPAMPDFPEAPAYTVDAEDMQVALESTDPCNEVTRSIVEGPAGLRLIVDDGSRKISIPAAAGA